MFKLEAQIEDDELSTCLNLKIKYSYCTSNCMGRCFTFYSPFMDIHNSIFGYPLFDFFISINRFFDIHNSF